MLGLGLYVIYKQDNFPIPLKPLDQLRDNPLNVANVHEAMGTSFSGKKAFRLYGRKDKMMVDRERPYLKNIRANQGVGKVLTEVQKAAAASYSHVKDKTAFVYSQGGNRYLQGRVTEKFQQASVL